MWRKGNPCVLLLELEISATTMESSMEVPQKHNNTLIKKDTFTPMLIAALYTVAKIWKQPKCLSTDECIKKM